MMVQAVVTRELQEEIAFTWPGFKSWKYCILLGKERKKKKNRAKLDTSWNLLKIDTSWSPLNSMKWRKIPSTKQVLNVTVIWYFFPTSHYLVLVEVIELWGKADSWNLNLKAGSLIIGIFQWLLVFGLFLLPIFTWPWPSSPVQALANHNVIMHCWDENLLAAPTSSPNPGAIPSEPMSAFNIFPVPCSA